MKDLIFCYWGKSRQSENNELEYHPLPYHSLDVAAVGEAILEQHPKFINFIYKLTGAPTELILTWVRLLLLLHDIGKFSRIFQNLNPELLKKLQGNLPEIKVGYSVRHDTLGYWAWEEWGMEMLENNILLSPPSGISNVVWENTWQAWMRSVTGHHGMPPEGSANSQRHLALNFYREDKLAIQEYLNEILLLLEISIPEWVPNKNFVQTSPRLSWWLAGIAVLSDWIGSNTDFFPYHEPNLDLPKYWEYAKERAENAVSMSGILPAESKTLQTFGDLFSHLKGDPPRPLQSLVSKTEIENSPHLFILEDLTGSGKTEAALMLTHRLMASNQASGFYFGLPTMATANAMYGRVGKCYELLFEQGSFPSIVLAHGARGLSKSFRQSIIESGKMDKDYDEKDLTATFRCSSWLADNRKKALLAQVGVGTVDQALLSILYSKHQSLRLLGLLGKVLIVDEVHAHDAYMHSLLKTLLSFHAAGGGSAILLSATLPQKIRNELTEAFTKGLTDIVTETSVGVECKSTEYPLLTHVRKDNITEIPVEKRSSIKRNVGIQMLNDEDSVVSFLIESSQGGRCSCWIRNTVKDARDGLQIIQNALIKNNLSPDKADLFHARFVMGNRLEIEERVLENFGKNGTNRRGKILVATQVVEQSLDLDFDEMVTDLAPIDLIIQRSGRLHRHVRNSQGEVLSSRRDERDHPILRIFGPNPNDEIRKDWYSSFFAGASYVYQDHSQLWRTAKVLLANSGFVLPDDSRKLIESVFGENSIQTPKILIPSSIRTEGKNKAYEQTGFYNSINLNETYSREGFDWWADSIAPTRLGEPSITLKLARWDGKFLRPWFDGEQGWAMSQVQVSAKYASKRVKQDDPNLEEQIRQLEGMLPDRGRSSVLLPMQREGDLWSGFVLKSSDTLHKFFYNKQLGLLREEEL